MLFPAALARHLRKRFISRKESETNDDTLPHGAVKKLVVIDGCWKERRWNDRWLKAHSEIEGSTRASEIWYCSDDSTKLIRRIPADEIRSIHPIEGPTNICRNENGTPNGTHTVSHHAEVSVADEPPASSRENSPLWGMIQSSLDDIDDLRDCFLLRTVAKGSGREKEYLFKTKSPQELSTWVNVVTRMLADAEIKKHPRALTRIRSFLRSVYRSNPFQLSVAILIALNFAANIFETQTNPDQGSPNAIMLANFYLTLSILFAIELGFNFLVSESVKSFCKDPWNW
mmetsp:Transcript_79515/g.213093  ORF Transcript_79515/g.213093 Transcript_79515/m.213093 type:complete len:286 (+) Transcript_79515:53-910(+)